MNEDPFSNALFCFIGKERDELKILCWNRNVSSAARYNSSVVALETKLHQSEQKNVELAAQLEVRERINTALVNQLEGCNRYLQEQAECLQRQLRELDERNRPNVELTTLLKEELAWFKAQVYGQTISLAQVNRSTALLLQC